MLEIIKSARNFLVMQCAFCFAGLIALAAVGKNDLQIGFNKLHTNLLDIAFKYLTQAAEGYFLVLLCLALAIKKVGDAVVLLAAYLISGGIVNTLKYIVFSDSKRPAESDIATLLKYVDGVDRLHEYSFPSGHAASAFSIFLVLHLTYKRQIMEVLFVFCAVIVAFSRVYLNAHFFTDIIVGGIIGSASGILAYFLFGSKKNLDLSLVSILSKMVNKKHK